MNSIMMAAMRDEFEKIAANFNFLGSMAKGHAQTIKALGGFKKAKGVEQAAKAALKPAAAAPKLPGAIKPAA